jgi:hypothetical protein
MNNPNLIPIETANKMLPLVSPIAKEMQKTWKQVINNTSLLEKIFSSEDKQPELLTEITMVMKKAMKAIGKNLDELEDLGCIVESFRDSVIDFPSEVDGEEVMLCWKLGEDEVLHYHRPGEMIRHRLLVNQVLE